jgi:hypothetical protein
MCSICSPLAQCPAGDRRSVVIDTPISPETIDAYGRKLFFAPVRMNLRKWDETQTDLTLTQDVHDENGVFYGWGIMISHCPFCGEKLR